MSISRSRSVLAGMCLVGALLVITPMVVCADDSTVPIQHSTPIVPQLPRELTPPLTSPVPTLPKVIVSPQQRAANAVSLKHLDVLIGKLKAAKLIHFDATISVSQVPGHFELVGDVAGAGIVNVKVIKSGVVIAQIVGDGVDATAYLPPKNGYVTFSDQTQDASGNEAGTLAFLGLHLGQPISSTVSQVLGYLQQPNTLDESSWPGVIPDSQLVSDRVNGNRVQQIGSAQIMPMNVPNAPEEVDTQTIFYTQSPYSITRIEFASKRLTAIVAFTKCNLNPQTGSKLNMQEFTFTQPKTAKVIYDD